MELLVVGSIALDSVKTPFGKVEEVLGGSATYFSVAASYFTGINLVAVVGNDFPEEHYNLLKEKDVNLKGLEKVDGKTFRWVGEYGYDLNEAHTIDTRLNVFETFEPKIPKEYEDIEYVFLANIDPEIQLRVLTQVKNPKLVACDTMNYWIEGKPDVLKELLKKVDILTINESEVRELTGEPNLVKAASIVKSYGVKYLIVKRGEYGVLMFGPESIFHAPAYPLEYIYDPTGAGDSFAGGFLGYLTNTDNLSENSYRQAIIFGSVMASFNVEAFSLDRLKGLSHHDIEERFKEFKRLTHFDDI
jgi:sugar/nucleoside kinase (ribokinase family)